MTGIVYINGEFFPEDQAKISVFDRGFLYGDSIYEVTRSYEHRPYKLQEHLDRLRHSAQRLGMELPYTDTYLRQELEKANQKVNLPSCYFRIIITRGIGPIGLDHTEKINYNLIIMARNLPPYPEKWYFEGLHFAIVSVVRLNRESLDPNVKSGNYLNNVLAMQEARKQGATDAIMLNRDGYVTEGTTSNVWMIKHNELVTPPLAAGILKGITRETIIDLCRQNDISVTEKNFTAQELKEAEEVFISSATKEIVPVCRLDDVILSGGKPGELTRKLMALYKRQVRVDLSLD